MRLLGIILIILGVVGLAYGGITYTRRSETVNVGPVSATVKEKETFPLSPIVSGVALLAGIALVVAGGRRRTA